MRDTDVVTLMLTDIERSTAQWEAAPEAMRRAVLLHDHVITQATLGHDGAVLTSHGEGDSHFAVFRLASRAVAAACAVQRELRAQMWPAGLRPRVRIALHSGEAGGDYRGGVANRCARVRALARGGQVLLTQLTAELARPSLPSGVRVVDLGRHELRDLGPERLFQLLIGGVEAGERPVGARRQSFTMSGTVQVHWFSR